MNRSVLQDCLWFFDKLDIEVRDVTTVKQRDSKQRVVEVDYRYLDKVFTTKPLYYREVSMTNNIKDVESCRKRFGGDVFVLDLDNHDWPQGSGESDLEHFVIDDIIKDGDNEFRNFLLLLGNNHQNGFVQKMTKDGQPGQYYHNLMNNNHWHDLVLLIKAVIQNKGGPVDSKYLSPLIYKWVYGKRVSMGMRSYGGDYKIITDLYQNIQFLQMDPKKEIIVELLEYKKQVILQGPPGTGKTKLAKELAEYLIGNLGEVDVFKSDQFELIQFHPSYTYEDFVRGIVSNPSEDGKGIIYKSQNKTLAKFAKRAFDNWSGFANPKTFGRSNWLRDTVDKFLVHLGIRLDEEDGELMLTKKAYITKITSDTIRYNAKSWDIDGGVPIIDLGRMFEGNVKSRSDVIKLETLTKTAKHLPTYWFRIYEMFKKFIEDNDLSPENIEQYEQAKKYVLIIDEINRANLSAVLGELIYALEYRGESVNSMYEVDGDKSIVLPPNLYIIGTMNTADRSVGYIDYAIRRRFAFVDVPSEELFELKEDFHSELFHKIAILFTDTYLAPEFNAKDIQLGHSYFIKQYEKDAEGTKIGKVYPFELRIEYEILPLLREYVRDGVLNEKATTVINKISLDYLGK